MNDGNDSGHYIATVTPDSIEMELTLLITITTLQSSVIMSFASFFEYQDLVEFDNSGREYITFKLAASLPTYLWIAVQLNTFGFIISWYLYICWRWVRPHPMDRGTARLFATRYNLEVIAIYALSIIGFFLGGVAYYQIMILRLGPNYNQQQNGFIINFFVVVVMVVLPFFMYWKKYQLSNELDAIAKRKHDNGPKTSETANSLNFNEVEGLNLFTY